MVTCVNTPQSSEALGLRCRHPHERHVQGGLLEEEEGGVGGGGGYRGERCRTSVFRSKAQLETRFEVKTKVVGKGEGEAIFLSRIIRVSTQGWEYQRDAELIVKALKLGNAKLVSTRGEDQKIEREEAGLEDLDFQSE